MSRCNVYVYFEQGDISQMWRHYMLRARGQMSLPVVHSNTTDLTAKSWPCREDATFSTSIWSAQQWVYNGFEWWFIVICVLFITMHAYFYWSSCLSINLSICLLARQIDRPAVCPLGHFARPSIHLSVCLSILKSNWPSVCFSICWTVHPPECLSSSDCIRPSFYLPISLSNHLSIHRCPSVRPSIHPTNHISICPSITLSILPAIHLFN